MKNYAIIGAAGYIATRHMKAIYETNNNLSLAYDLNDNVGSIDQYFPKCLFYTDYENFYYNCVERQKKHERISYISVCSPNYMHFVHCANSLRLGCNVICEKPLVQNPRDIDKLKLIEQETGFKIFNILQLRHHKQIIKLKNEISENKKKYDVKLTYITSRGNWYHKSWKGQENKSFGLLSNIGIHFFDMLYYVFGNIQESHLFIKNNKQISGLLELQNARVKWFLSIDSNDLPSNYKSDFKTFREITINGKIVDFTSGFDDLHTTSYSKISNGNGFVLEDIRPSIETVYKLYNSEISCFDTKLMHEKAKQ